MKLTAEQADRLHTAIDICTGYGHCSYQECVIAKLYMLETGEKPNWPSQRILILGTENNHLHEDVSVLQPYGYRFLDKIQEVWDGRDSHPRAIRAPQEARERMHEIVRSYS